MMKLFAVAYSFPNYSDISFLLSIILGAILVVFSDVFAFMFLKKKSYAVAHSILSALALASFAIGLYPLNFILLAVVGGYAITIAVTNINEIRINILNFIKGNNNPFKRSQKQPEALFDRDAMYGMINEAVLWFSRTKTGALITFEKRDPLDPFITTGVAINAPVSA
jgi:DNA integrity scanning protein DisA with diadenylate cyclase activity